MHRTVNSSWDGKDFFLYKDHITMQSPVAIEIFEDFFKYQKFDYIVEIGTAGGGWSIFLKEQADKMNCNFVTYDVQNFPLKHANFKDMNIDFRLEDCFSSANDIINILESENRVALFCDGGDKIKEFNTFSFHLKQGDFIFAHDYAASYRTFIDDVRGKWWDWCEITDDYISESLIQNNLVKYLPSIFLKSAWLAAYKNE